MIQCCGYGTSGPAIFFLPGLWHTCFVFFLKMAKIVRIVPANYCSPIGYSVRMRRGRCPDGSRDSLEVSFRQIIVVQIVTKISLRNVSRDGERKKAPDTVEN